MEISIPLEEAGLSAGEQKVYIALMRSGPSKVTSLKKSTQLHRTTIYDFLEALIKRGLVSYSLAGKTRIFRAVDPSRLLDIIDEKREIVQRSLPMLKDAMHGQDRQIDIEIYHGKDGLKTVLKKMFLESEAKSYDVVGAMMEFEEHLPFFMEHFIEAVEKRGVRGRVLVSPHDRITKTKYEEWRVLSQEFWMPTSLGIAGDFVVQVFWQPPFSAILIKNKEVARSFRLSFEALWRLSKPATSQEIRRIHRPSGRRFKGPRSES